MEKMMFRLVVLGCMASVAAYGTPDGKLAEDESTVSDVNNNEGEEDDCLGRADFDGVSPHIEAQLNIARRAVCRYRRLEAALADGYQHPGRARARGQGSHYKKTAGGGTPATPPPPVLMYTADGDLNSPEWVAPVIDFPTPPLIFGQREHLEDELGLWILHVWV